MQPGGRSDLHFDINSVCKLDEKIQTLSFILAFSLVALQRLLGGILLLKVFLSHMIMITTKYNGINISWGWAIIK